MAGPIRAGGYPDVSSTSSSGFIPAIWSGRLVEKFYSATVFGDISSTDYEGEISSLGDKVEIRTVPNIVIRDYQIGGGLTYDNPTSPKVELNIDRAKYFGFAINDIDAHQSDLALMDRWSDDGGEQMKIAIDSDLLDEVYVDVSADNSGTTAGKKSNNINLGVAGTPRQLAANTVIDFIVDMGQVLDEQDVPETGRWLVIPAWLSAMVKRSDLKDASISGDGTSIMRNGRIGMIDRFTLYMSNNLSMVQDGANRVTNVIAGHKAGLTFASQMTQMEDLKNPNDFGQLVRGLNVYGFKVIEGKYLAHGYVYK